MKSGSEQNRLDNEWFCEREGNTSDLEALIKIVPRCRGCWFEIMQIRSGRVECQDEMRPRVKSAECFYYSSLSERCGVKPEAIRGQSEYPWHFSTLRLSSCEMEEEIRFGTKHALIELQNFLLSGKAAAGGKWDVVQTLNSLLLQSSSDWEI